MARPPKQGACSYCDTYAIKAQPFRSTEVDGTHDHYIPLGRGGLDTDDNIVLACRRCNDLKSDYMPLDFISLAPSRKRALMTLMRQQERMSVRDLAEFGSSRWKSDPRLEILAKRFADARIGFAFTAKELEKIAADLAANKGGDNVGNDDGGNIVDVLSVLAKNGGYMTAQQVMSKCGSVGSGSLPYYYRAGYVDRRKSAARGVNNARVHEYIITDKGRKRIKMGEHVPRLNKGKQPHVVQALRFINKHRGATYTDVRKGVSRRAAKNLGEYTNLGYLSRVQRNGVYFYTVTAPGLARLELANSGGGGAKVDSKTDFAPIGIDTIKQAYGDDDSATDGEVKRLNQRISDVVRSVADETRNREDLAGRLVKRIATVEVAVAALRQHVDGIDYEIDGGHAKESYESTINGRLEAIESRLFEMRDDAKVDIKRKLKSAVGRIGKALTNLSE